MKVSLLAPGERFFDELAARLLQTYASEVAAGDLSSLRILVPALPMAAELRSALVKAAPCAFLLPCFDTLAHWAQAVDSMPTPLAESRRLVLLHEALRAKGWFDESALWGIAAEIAALFDELSARSVTLADGEAALAAQLEAAYALRASAPLAFEARVVHELWHALAATGAPDASSVYRLQLAQLAAQADSPLFVLLDAAPEESLETAERDFLMRYAAAQPVQIFYPSPRELRESPLAEALDAAWTAPDDTVGALPLYERAGELAGRHPVSPFGERLSFVPTAGRELEAQAVVAQVGAWLQAGLRRIALIAQDRLTARRVRALLEREGILVSDETGWLLSTSRAAAAVDALLEVVASNAYHRDLLDLCKSPFVFADLEHAERKAAVHALESVIRGESAKVGLHRMRRALLGTDVPNKGLLLDWLDRLDAANALLSAKPATLSRWINRLFKALESLGALTALADDVAGKKILELLEIRSDELASSEAVFSLGAWRDWLGRELESASFRDASIASPIVVTPLNAVCLRRFEAAVLIGGDARLLAPIKPSQFFNQSVRRELGLRTREDGERELRRDLELLIATVPRVVVTWQAMQDGEANLLAPELLLLSTLHGLAWGNDLICKPLPARPEADADPATAPLPTQAAAPTVPAGEIPLRISVSAYASLVACPYRFFARHVLRLGEMDEVSEEMEKSDYGELVHRVLERFHARYPLVSGMTEADAMAALQSCVADVFSPAIAENFLATGWRLRWEKRLAAYLAWQREREAEGWRWFQSETKVKRALALADGSCVELYGRIDRIDQRGEETALLDYKTQTAKAIRTRLDDDVQLAAYALMVGDAAQAAYVALDDEQVVAVASGDETLPLMDVAAAQGQRLVEAMNNMRAGVPLPAHGADRVCAWCEMSGLCRKGFVEH